MVKEESDHEGPDDEERPGTVRLKARPPTESASVRTGVAEKKLALKEQERIEE